MDDHAGMAAELASRILAHIPIARAMQLRIGRYDGDQLEMRAPLLPNINDKGCAFGGSLVSLMTLAGWGLVELTLRARGVDCDIYVGDSSVQYREPLWGELRATARFADAKVRETFLAALAERGKARIDVVCDVAGSEQPAATLAAAFVAKRR